MEDPMDQPTGTGPQPPAQPPHPTPQPQQPPGQPPQQQPAPQAGPKPPPLGYEFTPLQNENIRRLSSKMKFVGIFYIVAAVLFGTLGVAALFVMPLAGIIYIIAMIPELLIGIWTTKAASSFRMIVDTKGHDIPHLMNAVVSLRKLYTLQYWLLIIALMLIVVSIAVVVVLWMSGMLPMPGGSGTYTLLAQ
jgi:hypothetical protein